MLKALIDFFKTYYGYFIVAGFFGLAIGVIIIFGRYQKYLERKQRQQDIASRQSKSPWER